MKKIKLSFFIPCILTLGLIANACTPESGPDDVENFDSEPVSEAAFTDHTTDADVDFSLSILAENNSLGRNGVTSNVAVPSCASLNVVTGPNNTFPKTFTVDFGTAGCTDASGVVRKGKIIINISKAWYQTGSVMVITRENFYRNDKKIEGTITHTNQTVAGGDPIWTRQIQNGKITYPNGKSFQFYGNRTVSLVEGNATPTLADNVYKIYDGELTVVRSNGATLQVNITNPLFKKASCNYIGKGVLSMQGTIINGTLNYGNGECDNQAIFTRPNGTTQVITL